MREPGQDKMGADGLLEECFDGKFVCVRILTETESKRKRTYTCALQHLAFSERVASVRKQLSAVLPVIPGCKLWKAGVGGSLEPVDGRQVLFVGGARDSGYVVMWPVAIRVPVFQRPTRLAVVHLHRWQPFVIRPSELSLAETSPFGWVVVVITMRVARVG